MIRRAWAGLLLATMAGLFAGGCGGVDVPDHPDPLDHRSGNEAQELRVKARDVMFEPAELTAKTGVTIELALENLDDVEHDFQIDEIDAEIIEGGSDSGEHGSEHASGKFAMHADAHETASLTFVANDPGSYEFYCTIPGHRAAGMVGTLTVE